jgi:hypothetical protein
MSATNPNQEIDTLTVTQNEDGTFTMDWDENDPKWSWMNGLTDEQVSIIVHQAIDEMRNNVS